MSLEHAILGFLSERPMTGYDLKTVCFDESAAHFWTADQSQIYRTLDRLESRSYVRVRRERQSARPDRLVYSITAAGRIELERWVALVEPPPPLRDPFLIRIRFAEQLSDDALLGLLRERRDALQERLAALRLRSAHESVDGPNVPRSRTALLERMTLDASMARVRSEIDWIDDSLDGLTALSEQERPLSPGAQGRLFAPRPGSTEGSTA